MHPDLRPALSFLPLLLAVLLGGCVTSNLPPDDDSDPWQPRESTSPPPALPANLAGTTIVVDAGHGGKDPGAHAVTGTWEKSVNLAMSELVSERLAARGAQVIRSRDSDVFIELDDRAALAEQTRCDLLVSLHADSIERADIKGATLYVANGAGSTSLRVANSIDRALGNAGFPTRGVRSAGFRVLVGHSRPAVLVECGYLTNPEEAAQLDSHTYRAKLADAIAAGVLASGL